VTGRVRVGRCLAAIVLAVMIVAPVIPGLPAGPLIDALRWISVQQRWQMYTPDAERAHSYIAVRAEFADGSVVPLDEAIAADAGWGTIADWHKRRIDIWRGHIAMGGDKPNLNRSWYLRSLCVREERARGVAPIKLTAERVRRAFNAPAAVAAGAPTLAVVTRKIIGSMDCRSGIVRRMLEADHARRGLPPPDPPPMLRTPQRASG
jgi:hypothetical protein